MIFTLLTKMVVVYVRFPQVSFWSLSLKRLLLKLCLSLSLYQLYEYFHNFYDIVFGRKRNKRRSGSLKRGIRLGRTLIAFGIGSFYLILGTGKLVFLCKVYRMVDIKILTSIKLWNYSKNLTIILLFQIS